MLCSRRSRAGARSRRQPETLSPSRSTATRRTGGRGLPRRPLCGHCGTRHVSRMRAFVPTERPTRMRRLGLLVGIVGATLGVAPSIAGASTWFVRAGGAEAGRGTRVAPFTGLASVEARSRPGDRIVVLPKTLAPRLARRLISAAARSARVAATVSTAAPSPPRSSATTSLPAATGGASPAARRPAERSRRAALSIAPAPSTLPRPAAADRGSSRP